MARETFDRQLAALRHSTILLGEQAQAAVEQAIDAFTRQDLALAHKVVNEDLGINRIERQVLDESTTLLALQAPVATDLRTIIGVSRIANHFERIGDHARDIGNSTIRSAADPPLGEMPHLTVMLGRVIAMVHDGLRAYTEADVSLAETGKFARANIRSADKKIEVAIAPKNEVRVFPSIADRYIKVSVNGELRNASLDVLNVLGEVVEKRDAINIYGEETMYLDVSNLSSGTYVVSLSSDTQQQTGRFIIHR